ncbi:MAG: type VI secretion system tip protein VgrG [Reichenbachiella sp.]|uniref:type VI secretion system tip protein VgrG n=1 Tax=Reichenbachiella sp. TaxID=2184521 RepID=UPI003264C447
MDSNTDLTTFTILLEGTKIDESYEVMSIKTEKTVNKISTAYITLLDGSAAESDFAVSNKADFLPGAEIEIKAGYHSVEETIYKGIIVKHGISASDSASELQLECRDKAVKLTVGRKNLYFLDKKDSDIISAIISGAGLTADVDATTYQHASMIQYDSTDWDFLMTRADSNGLIVLVDDGKVSVKVPDTSPEVVLSVGYGGSILEFSAEIDAVSQIKSAKGYAWDSATQKVVNGTGKSAVKNTGNLTADKLSDVVGLKEYAVQSSGIMDANDLKSWAVAMDTRSKLATTQGSVKFQGNSKVKPGVMLGLEGVGERFNGNVFVSSVTHTVEDGQWNTEADFGLSPAWHHEENTDVSQPKAGGLLPGVSGLQIGTVKQIQEDPKGGFRVLTKIPILQQDKDAVWARLTTFYASNGCGSFFFPEVNDEVILGFLNDDPRYPVILGSVYSKKNKSPETPEEKNDKKAIITKSKMELSFAEEDKIILIKTPGGNQITISDKDKGVIIEDQNSNKLSLDDSGITLDSASNMSIKAKGNIELDAGGNLTLNAKANVTVGGAQIENTAKTSFTAKGNATAEVSASGQVTVKGGIVMIN